MQKRNKYQVHSNYIRWDCGTIKDAKRLARHLLKAKRLFSTHSFTCGTEGQHNGRLYYASMQALRQDQDGSAGVQIESTVSF